MLASAFQSLCIVWYKHVYLWLLFHPRNVLLDSVEFSQIAKGWAFNKRGNEKDRNDTRWKIDRLLIALNPPVIPPVLTWNFIRCRVDEDHSSLSLSSSVINRWTKCWPGNCQSRAPRRIPWCRQAGWVWLCASNDSISPEELWLSAVSRLCRGSWARDRSREQRPQRWLPAINDWRKNHPDPDASSTFHPPCSPPSAVSYYGRSITVS